MEEAHETPEAKETYRLRRLYKAPPNVTRAVAIARKETPVGLAVSSEETSRDVAFLVCHSCWRLLGFTHAPCKLPQ